MTKKIHILKIPYFFCSISRKIMFLQASFISLFFPLNCGKKPNLEKKKKEKNSKNFLQISFRGEENKIK